MRPKLVTVPPVLIATLGLLLAMAVGGAPAASDPPAGDSAAPAGHRRALLIGCTTYDHLPESRYLAGPGNDVALMKTLLEERFGFTDFQILTEEAGPDDRPTAAHIAREFERLIEATGPQDLVFILMAGHGSQQPVDPNDHDPENFEPDGMDEIFLPADVAPNADKGRVANAIVDNQIRAWLGALRSKGATIAIIVDSCHSGGMVRGADEETTREVPATELSSDESIRAAEQAAAKQASASATGAPESFKIPPDAPKLVAIYAAQATEPTVERKLPNRATDARPYGLLTFTINKVLRESRHALTYTELVQRIHAEYAADGRMFPTPMIEGLDKDNFVFSDQTAPERPPFTLTPDDDRNWHVNAGQLQGLTAGSILAVLPVAGTAGDEKPIGYVKVLAAGLRADSAMVDPCEYRGVPANAELVRGMRCRIEYLNLETPPLRIAIDSRPDSGAPEAERTALPAAEASSLNVELHKLDAESGQFVVIDDPAAADWLVCRVGGKEGLFLMPHSGMARAKDSSELPPLFGPIPRDGMNRWLAERLSRIARAQTLLKIVGSADSLPGGGPGGGRSTLDVQLLKLVDKNSPGEPLDKLLLHPGDRIGLRIKNTDREPVDVTVLFIDSGFGISTFFPRSAGIDNRLKPTDAPLSLNAKITAKTLGIEHVLVIATRPKPNAEPSDFSFLTQPTIERARALRGGVDAVDSPLGKLFQHAVFHTGGTRGLDGDDAEGTFLKLYSWRVEP